MIYTKVSPFPSLFLFMSPPFPPPSYLFAFFSLPAPSSLSLSFSLFPSPPLLFHPLPLPSPLLFICLLPSPVPFLPSPHLSSFPGNSMYFRSAVCSEYLSMYLSILSIYSFIFLTIQLPLLSFLRPSGCVLPCGLSNSREWRIVFLVLLVLMRNYSA